MGKAWGEVRYDSGSTTLTDKTYTGQRTYTASFGLMFYNARWYDPYLSRFAQADSIVPGGVQGYDRYAYTSNNPVNFNDPTGHKQVCAGHWDAQQQKAVQECHDDGTGYDPIDSQVWLGVGSPRPNMGGSQGLGTVIGNSRTIVTAYHVVTEGYDRCNCSDITFQILGGFQGTTYYPISPEMIGQPIGDQVTITLPEDMSNNYVPASAAQDYQPQAGQEITTYYMDNGIRGATTTLANPSIEQTGYGPQYSAWNPDQKLNSGDSGGGVFYQGQFIGANSQVVPIRIIPNVLYTPAYWFYIAPYR